MAEKPALYRRMGAREYFQFDPDRRTEPRLAGWRFDTGETRALPLVPVASMRGIHSEALGLHLCHIQPWPLAHPGHESGRLRWHDPATGAFLKTLAEQASRADDAERERDAEAGRAEAAERRAAEEVAARRVLEEKVAALEARLRQP